VSSPNDTDLGAALQQQIRNTLTETGAYKRVAARIAARRNWSRSRNPERDAERHRAQLCKQLDGIGGREFSVIDYALLCREIGREVIDFASIARGTPPQAA
jgi:hypothetical protein